MIFNIGGAAFKPPVLNPNYPADVSVVQSSSASATFQVVIQEAGEPAEYAYQWYVNNSPVSGATSASYTKSNLSSVGTYIIYCTVTHPAGVVTSRSATLAVQSSQPIYTYSGSHELIKDGAYGWKLKLKTSGKLRFTHLGTGGGSVQVFLVGGGGGGSGNGGGGGYTKTETVTIAAGTEYTITVGAGGAGYNIIDNGGTGGQSSAFGKTVNGGEGGRASVYGSGGAGGSGGGGMYGPGGAGGSDGGNGGAGNTEGGKGQGTTTREFGSSSGTLYSGGGGGAGDPGGAGGSGGGGKGANDNYLDTQNGGNGTVNTGGGGGGLATNYSYDTRAGTGGSGIVIIRNKR